MSLSYLDELKARHLLQDLSEGFDLALTSAKKSEKPLIAYIGIDPTASSMHVGNWATLMLLIRWQKAGFTPLVLIGDATALVGDPSGKSKERPLIPKEDIEAHGQRLEQQIKALFRAYGALSSLKVVRNSEWWTKTTWIDVLRETGVLIFPSTPCLRKKVFLSVLKQGFHLQNFPIK